MLIGFDKLTNSRFTGDGELPVIQSVHNEELAALKLKIKKVLLCLHHCSNGPIGPIEMDQLKSCFADAGGQ